MSTQWRLAFVGGGLGLSLVALAIVGGLASERVRFEHRTVVLNRYDTAAQREQKALAEREASNAPWTGYLQRAEEALAQKNVSAAELAWHDAYGTALRSRRWEGLVEVGEAYLRIGQAAGSRKAAEPKARQAYLAALFRARTEGSLDGVLRAAEAFAALGDREVAEQGVYIAQRVAAQARDAQASERVSAFKERLAAMFVAVESHNSDPL